MTFEPNPALENAARWLVQETGQSVTLDSLTWEEERPGVYQARCKVGAGDWEIREVPTDALAQEEEHDGAD